MSQTIHSQASALIEGVAHCLPLKAQNDFRFLMREIVLGNLTALSPGGNLVHPGGPVAGSSAPPAGVTTEVTGANGVFSVAIANPSSAKPGTVFHEISYSPLKSFTRDVVTMPPTTDANTSIPNPGGKFFFRRRSSFDKKTWGPYEPVSTSPIDAGLVESSAMSAGSSFNQTNFGVVNSAAYGGAVRVTVSGTGGLLTSYTAVKGRSQAVRPSATIVGVPPSVDRFVGWDGNQFLLKPTLAAVLADNLEPVGKVSVVSTGVPTLPTIDPVISGGQVVGFNVTSGGSGASQPYTLTFGSVGAGVGATVGAQNIQNGVLISVAPGNPGSGYSGGTTVTASGGSGGGAPGGGTAIGGNGGRLSAV